MLYTQLIICKYNENSVHERKFINCYKIAPLILFGWEMFRAALTAYPSPSRKREGRFSIYISPRICFPDLIFLFLAIVEPRMDAPV